MIRDLYSQRRTKLLLALVLVGMIATRADAEWQDDYDAGVKAAEAQNWAVAEAKLQSALAHQPKQGKKVRVYGTRFIRYIPSYYLGLVYLNTGRTRQAVEQFSILQNNNILSASDPEYARMQAMMQTAMGKSTQKPSGPTPEQLDAKKKEAEQQEQQRIAQQQKEAEEKRIAEQKQAEQQKQTDQQRQIEQQKRRDFESLIARSNEQLTLKNYEAARRLASQAAATGIDPQKTASLASSIEAAEKQSKDVQAKETAQQNFDRYLSEAKHALAESNYEKARSFAEAAKGTKLDDHQITDLLKEIDRQEKLAIADSTKKQATTKPESKPASPQDSDLNKLEEDAVLAFYSGNYSQSVALLQRLVSRKQSARLYFYLGCNNAALAFLAGKTQGASQLQKARESFAQAHKIDPSLRPDQKFISPRILQLYRQSI